MYKLEMQDISYHYPSSQSRSAGIDHISLQIPAGEFCCLLGPSGCGKSTLLNVLAGLNHPQSGRLLIDGLVVNGPGLNRAVVFQHYSLFPWLTARQNIVFGIRQSGQLKDRREQQRLASHYLEKTGLSHAADQYPGSLSGGMQQRVAIARALAMNADILLMDEPFGALDPRTRAELQLLLSRLCQAQQKTVVFVTHHINEALLLADRVMIMSPQQLATILPVTLARPRHPETLLADPAYPTLRRQLLSLFYHQVADELSEDASL
ncbi:ABC transporter ATP-binding protein [Oscillospiraceae bacterium HV4-5-C5C]|nr:ABC transporter ATP-binding protein [Oscillospiraceae bacterium HV4-5-C5C]